MVTSSSYVLARLHLDDLNWHRRRYNMWSAYAGSKLANLLFVQGLVSRGMAAHAADPGTVDSAITRDSSGLLRWIGIHVHPHIGMSPADGARASLQAATTDLPNAMYFAPRGFLHQWGEPKVTKLRPKARDPDSAQRLWEISAELTGCDIR